MLALAPRTRLATRLEEHYALAQRPFALTLDQHFLYQSRSYATVLADVRLALDRRDGLVVVTGETGTGKTMLCRTLLDHLGATSYVSIVLDPRVTVEDLLRHVLADFGVFVAPHGPPPSRHQLMRALQGFLATLVPTGACASVVVDEAQQLDPDVLQQLCLLLNLETNESKLLQVVLVGHTSLNDILNRAELAQLNQRVARRCALEPLDNLEVGAYIRHRLATAQRLAVAADIDALRAGDATIEAVPCNLAFTSAAVRAIARQSQGIPRVVNLLCDRALEIGYERRTHTIRALTVRAAATRVIPARPATRLIPSWPGERSRGRIRAAAIAAAVTVGVVGVGVGAWSAGGDERGAGLPPPPPAFAAAAAWSPRPEMGRLEVFDRIAIWNGALSAEPKGAVLDGDPRLLGVALVRRGGVVSFALDMSAEPRRAMLHPVSDRVFELEVGPVVGPVRTEELSPASEVPLVSQLSIREQRTTNELFVRARVMLRTPGRADVRVDGRVVYVDIQPVAGSR